MVCFKARGVNSDEIRSAGLHEKQAVATWNFGKQLGICPGIQGNEKQTYVDMANHDTFRMHTEF
jgi:hypothetical protein